MYAGRHRIVLSCPSVLVVSEVPGQQNEIADHLCLAEKVEERLQDGLGRQESLIKFYTCGLLGGRAVWGCLA